MTSPVQYGEEADNALIGEVEQGNPLIELGSTGLKRAGGYVDEEFLPQLRGRKANGVYREMGENDPIIGALLFSIVQLCRNVDFTVKPAGKGRDAANAAKLIETSMDDMSHTWGDLVAEAIQGKLQYGWSWHEVVLKRSIGPWEKTGETRSKYTDGLYRWRRMPVRSQDTLHRWVFDAKGQVTGMLQMAPPDYQLRPLPLEKSVLFRHGQHKGNPEGRSLLRNAYRPWFYKKRLEEFESVGVERDLAGLPMVKVPSDYLRAKQGTDQAKMVDAMRKMVRAVRRNEQEGLVFPTAYDKETKQPLFEFELLGSGGARQFSTNELIQRYEQRILMSVLADFILVGHEQTGSYNMHLDKTGIFRAAINQVVQSFCDDINRHVVPKLFLANGWKPSELPEIVPSDVDAPNLTELVGFLTGTAQLGFNWGPDADMERFLRNAAGLPELGDDDYSKRRKLARQTEATQMLETQTAYLAARSALAQATVEEEMAAAGEQTPEEVQATAQDPGADPATAQAQGEQAQAQAAGAQVDVEGKQIDNQLKAAQGEQQLRHAEEAHQVDMKSRLADSGNRLRETRSKVAESKARERAIRAKGTGASGNTRGARPTKGTKR